MDLFKYSKLGFIVKIIASILAISLLPLMFFDGFFDENVEAGSKGWNLIVGVCYIVFAIVTIISASKEKNNKQPLYGCLTQTFFGLFFLWSLFWCVMSFVAIESAMSYWSGSALINIFVSFVSIRELFIKKIYSKSNPTYFTQ